MARKSDALGVIGAETMIGAGVMGRGTLTGTGDITVEGSFVGPITTSGDVMLGVNAVVTGDVTARNVSVAGTLKGNVTAEGEAAITETGHLTGDVHAGAIAIASGAVFLGRSSQRALPRLERAPDDEG